MYELWAEDYLEAQSLTHGRDKAVQEVAEKIEVNLSLLGATAIEDRLQVNVPETLRDLLRVRFVIFLETNFFLGGHQVVDFDR